MFFSGVGTGSSPFWAPPSLATSTGGRMLSDVRMSVCIGKNLFVELILDDSMIILIEDQLEESVQFSVVPNYCTYIVTTF